MKFRNKETREIRPAEAREDGIYLYDKITEQWYKYGLRLLAEYWEYYEEPKEYWYINEYGTVTVGEKYGRYTIYDKSKKNFGNYFETKEEAEKVVEKFKAWKRLKDKGIEFYGWRKNHTGTYDFLARWKCVPPKMQEIINELDLLFGGEE